MTFHKTVELTPVIREALQAETLTFNCGQWVQWPEGAKGRFISNKGGIITILWRYKAESFSQFNARFTRSCQGHKVSRPAQSPLADTAPTPKLQQQYAFYFDLLYVRTFEAPSFEEFDDPRFDEESERYIARADGWQKGYRLLMQCRSALLLQSEVTGRKSIVLRDSAKASSLLIYPARTTYSGYPAGWGAKCH